jgi:hypothetical protein
MFWRILSNGYQGLFSVVKMAKARCKWLSNTSTPPSYMIILSLVGVIINGALDRILNLLTTYTHDSEL